jgi:hypothetical protein
VVAFWPQAQAWFTGRGITNERFNRTLLAIRGRGGLAGGAVVPDGGGDREGPLSGHSSEAASAVQFQVELAFAGVVDRLDELPDRGQQVLTRPWLSVAQ